jgi:hypothetical protein
VARRSQRLNGHANTSPLPHRFTVSNVRLGSIGLQLDQPTDRLRLISTQLANSKDDGPDYKVPASSVTLAPVPEPSSAPALVGLAAGLLRRRRA